MFHAELLKAKACKWGRRDFLPQGEIFDRRSRHYHALVGDQAHPGA